MKKVIALFPGQGSQKVGMGEALFESSPVARRYFEAADKALGFSLSEICFRGPAEKLTLTEIAQPAILTVSTICYQLFAESAQSATYKIVAAAGHSLGEYSALVAAGAIEFSAAVSLVHKRGKYMQEAVPAGQGKMVAVLGKDVQEIEHTLANLKSGLAQIANVNAPGQVVVAGHAVAIDELKTIMTGTKMLELPVSAPFHCALMKPAAERLAKDLDALKIDAARFPIYANFSGTKISSDEQIRAALKEQVCGRVRWVECMHNAATENSPELSLEFGAGNVLSGLLKRINPELERKTVGSISELEAL